MYAKIFSLIFIVTVLAIAAAAQSEAQLMQMMSGKTPLEAKKPGTVRIGISAPQAEMGKDFTMSDTPMAVMNTLQVALTDTNVETIFLDSALPEREAKQKECDYVFISKVTRKKGGGGFGSMMGMGILAGAAGMIPGVGGIVGSVAASSVMTAASISGGFKSKDEVGFEYRVVGIDGSEVVPATVTRVKAKKDGEDVLTPQIAKAAETTLAKIPKPQPQAQQLPQQPQL